MVARFFTEIYIQYALNLSFDRESLLDDKAKAEKFILSEMCAFQSEMTEMHTFQLKVRAFRSKWEHFTLKCIKQLISTKIS